VSLSKRHVRVYRGYPRGLAGQIAAAAGCARIGMTALPFFEGSLDLDADRVGLFCDPQTAAFGPSQRFGTYDGHKDVVLLERLLDVLAKIDPNGMLSMSMKHLRRNEWQACRGCARRSRPRADMR
jgi:hypothetical protein